MKAARWLVWVAAGVILAGTVPGQAVRDATTTMRATGGSTTTRDQGEVGAIRDQRGSDDLEAMARADDCG
jgi:hypothetical protein